MMLKVFHCGPTRIDTFNCDEGVHFGGKQSALIAGSRKRKNNLFLHECLINVGRVYETFDVANKQEWDREVFYAKQDGYQVLSYLNRYEPDIVPSYIVLDSSLITIVNVTEV